MNFDPITARFALYKTASGTFRILVNGQVHPLFVGYLTAEQAIERVLNEFPQQKVYLHDEVPWRSRDYYYVETSGRINFYSQMHSVHWQEFNLHLRNETEGLFVPVNFQ